MVEDTRQCRRRRFRPSHDDKVERGQDLVARHDFVIGIVLHERSDKVRSIRLHVQAPVDLFVRVFRVPALSVQNTLRDEFLEEEFRGRVVARSGGERHALEIAEQRAHPRMVFPILQTAKRLAESQIPDDVHGEEIQPVRHVDQGPFSTAILADKCAHLTDHGVRMPIDQGMLSAKSILGEGVAQEGTSAKVKLGIVGRDDVIGLFVWCCSRQFERGAGGEEIPR